MTKTSRDIAERALQELSVIANDEVGEAEDYAYATDTLTACLAELSGSQGVTYTWDENTIPDTIFVHLARWVAADMASYYMVQPPVPRSRAVMAVRAALVPDDREDPRDIDDNGTISTEEVDAGRRATYY